MHDERLHSVIIENLPEGLRRLADEIRVARFDKPASAMFLAHSLDTDNRSIAASVEELIVKHRLPIGSTRGAPSGYFWIRNKTELDAACLMLHNTAMKLLVREKALKRTTNDALLNQIRFSLITGESPGTERDAKHPPAGPTRAKEKNHES